MMYQYLKLKDGTEIVHSEMLPGGRVKVCVEKPDKEDGLHTAYCYLPQYEWFDIYGFTEEEIEKYQKILESVAHIIIELSQCGGFENASNF